jgi:hypothetical protein
MTAVYPGGAPNTFVPSTDATNNLTVTFSRNIQSFPLNKYVQIVPVTKSVGLYTKLGFDDGSRILQENGADAQWNDGDDAPDDRGQTDTHEFLPYATKRYARGFRIGELAVEQASWDILSTHAQLKARKAMTFRTMRALKLFTTAGNYPATNTSAVSSISGVSGKWNLSTTARMDIKRSLDYGMDIIRLYTDGAILPGEVKWVMSPGCARKISVCQEIVDFIKGSTDAREYIKGSMGPNAQYGLPASMYGAEIVVEDTVRTTSRKGATLAKSYALSDSTSFLCSRPGGLVAPTDSNSAPNFSTGVCFMKEEMSVESKYDKDNRVHKGRVVENFVFEMTAGVSGFLFTAAVD